MEHHAAAVRRPGDEHSPHDGRSPVHDPDRGRVNRQAAHEVLGAVKGVQHPDEVGRRRLLSLLVLALFAEHAVAGKVLRDGKFQKLLALLVGVGHRVSLLLVFELYLEFASAEVTREN